MDKKVGVGGVSRITVTSVLSESAEKKLWRNLLGCHLISGIEIFMPKRGIS